LKSIGILEPSFIEIDLSMNSTDTYVWDDHYRSRGYNIDFNGTIDLQSVLVKSTSMGHTLWIDDREFTVIESPVEDWFLLQLKEPIKLAQARITVQGKIGSRFYYSSKDGNKRAVGNNISVWSCAQPEKFTSISNNYYSIHMKLRIIK